MLNLPVMLEVLMISVVLVVVAFGLFGIRVLFIKNGEFKGTCAGNSPYLRKEGIACGVCGAKPGENCAKEDKKETTSQSPV